MVIVRHKIDNLFFQAIREMAQKHLVLNAKYLDPT